jgi:hypothetical protein
MTSVLLAFTRVYICVLGFGTGHVTLHGWDTFLRWRAMNNIYNRLVKKL